MAYDFITMLNDDMMRLITYEKLKSLLKIYFINKKAASACETYIKHDTEVLRILKNLQNYVIGANHSVLSKKMCFKKSK